MRRALIAGFAVLAAFSPSGPAAPRGLAPGDLDAYFEGKWAEQGVAPARLTTDAEFLRRLWIDLCGAIPPAEEARRFLDDPSSSKREAAIDALLASDTFVDRWTEIFTGLWIDPPSEDFAAGRDEFVAFVRDSLASGKPMNRLAWEILAAEGRMGENPAVHFLYRWNTVPQRAAAATRAFLGVPLRCAQCHDHPFEPITRDDYWSVAAFFARTEARGVDDGEEGDVELVEWDDAIGIASDDRPLRRDPAIPASLRDAPPLPAMPWSPRKEFAAWATSPGNPYFSRCLVNQAWDRLFTRGIFHPVDAFGTAHPPSHPEILDALARDFARDFDLRRLLRLILSTRTYQRAVGDVSVPDAFASMEIRPLRGTELFSSLLRAMGVEDLDRRVRRRFQRRMETYLSEFENLRAPVGRVLVRMNGEMVRDGLGTVQRMQEIKRFDTVEERIEWLYLATLSRRPTADEVAFVRGHLDRMPEGEAYEDILWTLVNCDEFAQRR